MRHTRVLLLNERIIHSLTSYHFFASNQKNGEVLDTTRIQNGQRTCKTCGVFAKLIFQLSVFRNPSYLTQLQKVWFSAVVFC